MTNINAISFGSNYLIPFNQVKESKTMKSIGKETVKCVQNPNTDLAQTKDGIVVKVEDSKDKEYEAIIAKYGINIQKYEGEMPNKELQTPPNVNLKPTGAPMIKFTDKSGEKFMAREVQLQTGDTCMAVSNEKEPSKATLMNSDEFKKFFTENCKQVTGPSFSGKDKTQNYSGKFADKKFTVTCKNGMFGRTLAGEVDDLDYKIKHNGHFFKADTISGEINGKDLDLDVKTKLGHGVVKGYIGDDPVDLKIYDTFNGYKITGKFKDEDVNIKVKSKLLNYSIESDDMSLKVKGKSLFSNDVRVKGQYNADPELIPLLMDFVYTINNDEEAAAAMLIA